MADHSGALALYNRALDGFDAVVSAVPAGAWENQSPCEEWKAIDVAGHVIGVQRFIVNTLTGVTGETPSARELAGPDPAAAFRAACADLRSTVAQDGILDTVVPTPFGQMPAGNFLGVLVADALTHTWDLAKAAGVPVTLDPELVAVVTAAMTPMDAMIRRPGTFDAKVEPPAGADDQTKLMAFLGRRVDRWG